jgi:hypothetical protein
MARATTPALVRHSTSCLGTGLPCSDRRSGLSEASLEPLERQTGPVDFVPTRRPGAVLRAENANQFDGHASFRTAASMISDCWKGTVLSASP